MEYLLNSTLYQPGEGYRRVFPTRPHAGDTFAVLTSTGTLAPRLIHTDAYRLVPTDGLLIDVDAAYEGKPVHPMPILVITTGLHYPSSCPWCSWPLDHKGNHLGCKLYSVDEHGCNAAALPVQALYCVCGLPAITGLPTQGKYGICSDCA